MKNIKILALDDSAATIVTSPIDVFKLPWLCKNACWETPFPTISIQIATPTGKPVQCLNGITIIPHIAMGDVQETDLVMI